MDMTFTATPMVAEALVTNAVVRIMVLAVRKVASLVKRATTLARLSIGGVSLNAIAPDHILEGGTA